MCVCFWQRSGILCGTILWKKKHRLRPESKGKELYGHFCLFTYCLAFILMLKTCCLQEKVGKIPAYVMIRVYAALLHSRLFINSIHIARLFCACNSAHVLLLLLRH